MSDKPRILLVVPRLNIGGAESYVVTAATGLKKRGYHVVVASWGGALVKVLKQQEIPHRLVPIRLSAKLTSLMLEYIIRRDSIDIVHANSAAAGLGALTACRKLDIPMVYTAHGVIGNNTAEMKLDSADAIICVSHFLKQLLITKGFSEDKLEVIYNGVGLDKFTFDPSKYQSMREEFGFSDQHFVLGLISRITNLHSKGHDAILQVLSTYPESKDWRVMVIGKGAGLWSLKRQVRKLGIEEQVVFCGYQSDVSQYMQAMDVVILPSKFETFGLVLAEAQCMSKPTVAYNVGGMAEAIEDGKTGTLVPYGDINALFTAIKFYQNNITYGRIAGDNGRERVKSLFDSEIMVEKVINLYYRILNH